MIYGDEAASDQKGKRKDRSCKSSMSIVAGMVQYQLTLLRLLRFLWCLRLSLHGESLLRGKVSVDIMNGEQHFVQR